MSTNSKLVSLLITAIVIIALVVLLLPFTIVGAGEQAVITRNGAVARIEGPGMHFVAPIFEGVVKFDTRTQKEQTDANASSADLQTVDATVAVNYNVVPGKVADMYTRIGTNFQSTVIDPAIQEAVKAATAKYTAEELITKRADVTDEIKSNLTNALATDDIQVTSVSVINFSFSDSFNTAVEAKVTAEQNALAAENQVAQTQAQASSTIIAAQAQAQAIEIQAQAINSEGGADYVQLQAIKAWNGVLPAQMVPGATVPFINLTK